MSRKDEIYINYDKYLTEIPDNERKKLEHYEKQDENEMRALIPGTILSVNIKAGQQVKKGETMLILEAMKMRNRIYAFRDGTIRSVEVEKGDKVFKGQLLITLK